ncbi:hypothetical protein GE061_012666 [Apolygus lucorum]|uniref:DNA/RNA-binding domain-containing protein n=1 Tax=Apolygus lucorum TaxID=248454 RepID=A0A6A4JTI7_APOLU|nr:hypothetical protein GE061_012666 [Apolygus lucorum]
MVSRVAVEVLNKAEELKERAATLQKNESSIEVNPAQLQLQKIYHDVLILDLEYALDEKVEQDLWNLCFKNHIVALQNLAKDKKNNGSHLQTKLVWFLDCASGFYLSLLQEICSVFNLDLPFMRHDSLFGLKRHLNENMVINKPSTPSCYYICQYCLVHLGDIARYRNQMIHAESFYRHAVTLCASSGHPYNQLALLEATRCEPLSTVFYYTRSIAVKCRFPVAKTNLSNTLLKWTKNELPVDGSKISVTEYEAAFLQLHALIYLSQDVAGAQNALKLLTHALTPLVATQEISSWKLIQMAVITIFMFSQVDGKAIEVHQTLIEYLSGFLNSLLVPIYTIPNDSVLHYFGLPAIKVVLSWFQCDQEVVNLMDKPHIWKGICKLLNSLRACNPVAPINYANVALPEDHDLQGFSPLDSALSDLSFTNDQMSEDITVKLRSFRILKLGEWLAKNVECKPIHMSDDKTFEVAQFQQLPLAPDSTGMRVQQQNPGTTDGWKNRSRQNVALQSLLKKSQAQVNEKPSDSSMKLEWNENRSGSVDWWPQGVPARDQFGTWAVKNSDAAPSVSNQEGTYSLFSGTDTQQPISSSNLHSSNGSSVNHQSLWSGPGPSPLERLLEQQKQQRNTMQYDT